MIILENAKCERLCGCTEMGGDVPGDLVRFQVVFWLTSNINASYLHVSTVKVSRISISAAHKPNKGYNLTSPLSGCYRSQLLQAELGWLRAMHSHRLCGYASELASELASGLRAQRAMSRLASCFAWTPWNGRALRACVTCVSQGVVQSGFDSWNTLQPVTCLELPCNFGDPVRDTASPHVPVDFCMYNEGRREEASAM